jgi:hypothetical protein
MLLAACDDPFHPAAPPPVLVTKVVTPDLPAECTSPDPNWIDPPKGFEPIGHVAEREQKNHDHFSDMKSDRAVCRAGVKAAAAKPKG